MSQSVDYGTDLMGRPTKHRGECPECHTFRPDGKPPTSHRFTCSQYVDLGVLRWADSQQDPRRRFRTVVAG